MNSINRRNFIRQMTVAGLATLIPISSFTKQRKRIFKMSLNPGAIGVRLNQQQLLEAAMQYGFEAIVPLLSELELNDAGANQALRIKMKANDISWDAANLPVEFREDEETFQSDLRRLIKYAPVMQKLDIKSCSTWIMPTHGSLTYLENFKQHNTRLKQTANILEDFDIKLGLEYVGPKTLMSSKKYPFLRSLKETQELISETQTKNIGVQLDSFHWHCAEETIEDLLSLKPEEIITCDLNDAVKGRSVEQQIDYERELPGISGVIDLKRFLGALITIGYKGSIRAEPFNTRLNEMDDNSAIALTKQQMDKAFALIN